MLCFITKKTSKLYALKQKKQQKMENINKNKQKYRTKIGSKFPGG